MQGSDLMRDGKPVYELAGSGEAVMEIKSAGSYPAWLVEALSQHRIYPQSFSKYGEAYRQSFLPASSTTRTMNKPATANVAVMKGSASCLKAS